MILLPHIFSPTLFLIYLLNWANVFFIKRKSSLTIPLPLIFLNSSPAVPSPPFIYNLPTLPPLLPDGASSGPCKWYFFHAFAHAVLCLRSLYSFFKNLPKKFTIWLPMLTSFLPISPEDGEHSYLLVPLNINNCTYHSRLRLLNSHFSTKIWVLWEPDQCSVSEKFTNSSPIKAQSCNKFLVLLFPCLTNSPFSVLHILDNGAKIT